MHDIKQLATILKTDRRVTFEENGWQVMIKVRGPDSIDVILTNHSDHGTMEIHGWYFFRATKTIRQAIELANKSLTELEDMRSNPNGWPPSDRHIWQIRGGYTGHPNARQGCLFALIPIISLFFFLIIIVFFFQYPA